MATELTHRRRASTLGGVATVAFVLLGAAALYVSASSVRQTGLVAVPVEEAVLTVTLAGVGLALLMLGWFCALGTAAVASPAANAAATAGARGNGLRGARVGAVLLALTLTTPPAHAQGTGEGVAPTSTMAARTVAPTMSGSDSGPAPEEPLPSIPLPGWESLRPEATDAAESDRVDAAADGESVAAQRSVLVTRGDTLWAIAASHLAPEATVAEIAASWPQWYAENRRTIGPDPDLLRPGQVLHPPADAKDLPASDPSPGESP